MAKPEQKNPGGVRKPAARGRVARPDVKLKTASGTTKPKNVKKPSPPPPPPPPPKKQS